MPTSFFDFVFNSINLFLRYLTKRIWRVKDKAALPSYHALVGTDEPEYANTVQHIFLHEITNLDGDVLCVTVAFTAFIQLHVNVFVSILPFLYILYIYFLFREHAFFVFCVWIRRHPDVDDEEAELDKEDNFEAAYNFRFQDPNGADVCA